MIEATIVTPSYRVERFGYEETRNVRIRTVTPEEALQRQIAMYGAMTGERRLNLAFDLNEFAYSITRDGIRHQFPDASEAEVERELRRRIVLRREIDKQLS